MLSGRKPAAGGNRIFMGFCLLLLAGPAAAQTSQDQQSAIRNNCRSDFMSNCSGVTPGGPEALQCLQRNVAKLSPGCQSAVSAATPQPATAAPAARPAATAAPSATRANTAPTIAPQPPTGVPVAIYVADFDLDPEAFHAEKGGPLQQLRPGLIDKLVKGDAGSKDPAERARALVDMMGRLLVQNLTAAGLNARRLAPGEAPPKQGWLVHGRFTTIDEGNRVERSAIGFGEGKTDLKVAVVIDDLKSGTSQPLFQTTEGAQSSKMPGSVVTAAIKFNPYAMAAKFVMSGFDTERNVMKTAGEISNDIIARTRK